MDFTPSGTCSRRITIRLDGDRLDAIWFEGGCTGNLQALAALTRGRPVEEVIAALEGIQCRNGTSCPDQLARALRQARGRQGPSDR